MNRRLALLLAFAALPARALAPGEFAKGIDLQTQPQRPLQELALPDALYAGVVRADLGDLRVFNAEGVAVPHALCAGPAFEEPQPAAVNNQELPVFGLRDGVREILPQHVHVDVESGGSTDVHVSSSPNVAPDAAPPEPAAYIVDASGVADPIRALRLTWDTADGASLVMVSVEASDDLDRWRTVVDQTTLLKADAQGRKLERMRIELPTARYQYLRLQRADDGPPPRVNQVIAEIVHENAARETALRWFDALALPALAPQTGLPFDAGRQAPVEAARIALPASNMTITAALAHRLSAALPWEQAWSGEVFRIDAADGTRSNADARFAATTQRWWRVQVTQGFESLAGQPLALQLGYRPQTLRFVAQGTPPFTLAYGSSRAEAAPSRACQDLLQQMPALELRELVGAATPGAARELGGEAMREAPPRPTPTRLVALWVVLIFGSAILLGMAFSVLRRVRAK
jgi:hypothetical protein